MWVATGEVSKSERNFCIPKVTNTYSISMLYLRMSVVKATKNWKEKDTKRFLKLNEVTFKGDSRSPKIM